MQTRTAQQRLLDLLLGEPVEQYLAARRAEGMSWRRIELTLLQTVGESVSFETLRKWGEGIDGAEATEAEA